MALAPIVVISVLVGLVAGGFSWFVWELAQNLRAMFRARAPRNTTPLEAAREPSAASAPTSSGRGQGGRHE